MNKDKYVFAQMVEFLENYKFLRIVKKYNGNILSCGYHAT